MNKTLVRPSPPLSHHKIFQKGYIAITSMLVVMISLMIFLSSVHINSSGGLQSTLIDQLSEESYLVAESCLDDTLFLLRSDPNHSGGNLYISDGFCTITIQTISSDTKEIIVQGSTSNTYFQSITARVRIVRGAETTTLTLLSKKRS